MKISKDITRSKKNYFIESNLFGVTKPPMAQEHQSKYGAVNPVEVEDIERGQAEIVVNDISAWEVISRLSAVILSKQNHSRILAASILTILSSASNFLTPYLLGETAEGMINNEKLIILGIKINPLTLIFFLITAYTVGQIVPNVRDQVLIPLSANNTRNLLLQVTANQLNKSLDYHTTALHGEQIYLIEKAYSAASTGTSILTHIAPTLFEIVIAIVVLSNRFDWIIGLVAAFTIAIYFSYVVLTTKQVIQSREVMLQKGNISWQKMLETIKQYRNIHDFGKLAFALEAVELATQESTTATINAEIISLKISLGHIIIPRLGMLAAALYVGHGVKTHQYDLKNFLLMVSYFDKLCGLIPSVGGAINKLFSRYPDLKFVFGELAKPPGIVDLYPDVPLILNEKHPLIHFDNVTFAYPKNGEVNPVLNGISFTVTQGSTVALVSRSGGGKSTIFKLLFGYNKPNGGKIYINGQDITHVSLKALQSSIGLMTQNPSLSNDTIRCNIRYGALNPDDVSDKEIMELAKKLKLDEFLNTLRDGLETVAGEDGKALSGGEQQRVAIIRGLFKQAPIRLFDEITSGLDNITSSRILKSIQKITQNETKIIITHQLAEAQLADKILVLDKGKVLAQGLHADLMKNCSLYLDLWNEQNKKMASSVEKDTNFLPELMTKPSGFR